MRLVLIFIFIWFFALPIGFGQTARQQALMDSLRWYDKQDAMYLKLSNELANIYRKNDPDKADSLYNMVIVLAQKRDDIKNQLEAYAGLVGVHRQQGNFSQAFEYATGLQRLAEQHKDEEKINFAYAHLGLIMMDQGFFDRALEYLQLTYNRGIEQNDIRAIAGSLHSMAAVYWQMDSLDRAITLMKEALEVRKANDFEARRNGIKQSLIDLAYLLNENGQSEEALAYVREGIAIAKEDHPIYPHDNLNAFETLAQIHLSLGQLEIAERIALKALKASNRIGVKNTSTDLTNLLSKIYIKKDDYQKAYQYNNAYWELKDSISNLELKSRISELETQYETEKKENEIIALRQKNRRSQNLRNLFGAATLIAFFFAFMLYTFYRFRQRKNRELLAAQQLQTEQLESVNAMKSRFLANISHEFRTPLTLILGPTEKLLEKADKKEEQQQLQWIKKNGQRLLQLINQLLDLSKIEANKLELKYSHQDVVQLVKYVISAFESLASQKQVQLQFKSNLQQLYLYCDVEMLEQVLNNLLNNAFKFTHDGFVRLSVEQEGDTFTKITVRDSGIGIHEQELPYIFDRFFQAQQGEQTTYMGTGIGLALCKELVELHSGTIEVESKIGKGSSFTILLPLGKDHLDANQIVMKTAYSPKSKIIPDQLTSSPFERTSPDILEEVPLILIADDNRDMLDYMEANLGSHYRLLKAGDGQKAWELAQQEIPDLIVSDVMMPNMNGYELCNKLKNDFKTDHIPVILLTARVGEAHKIKGLENQADEYLQKPFSNRELQARIQNLIEIRKRLQLRYAEQIIPPSVGAENQPKQSAFIEQLTIILEENLDSPQLDVQLLSSKMHISKSQLNRKMKAVFNKTPNQYIRSFRLTKARQLMVKHTELTLAEIAYDVGFSSPAYFSKCFHDEFGYPPSSLNRAK